MRFIGLALVAGISLAAADRVITLQNKCSSNVYFQVTAGSAPNVHGSGSGCTSNGDCINGAFCKPVTNLCFWNTPSSITSGGGFGLAPGQSRDMVMPYLANSDIVWSGNIGGCIEGPMCSTTNFTTCSQQGCGSSGGATLAEFTLLKTGTDYYDVSIINGISVPMQMSPSISGGDVYTCKTAGEALDGNTWRFTPPSNDYVWVSLENNPQGCNTDADCHNGFVCGLSRNPAGNIFKKSCGSKLGYWTGDQVCGMNGGMGAPFNCQQDAGEGRTKMVYLLCSNGISSCYSAGAPADCCGCANWWEIGVPQVSSNSKTCVNSSGFWTNNVLPELMFLKKGCPKCYTYPYDDITSTFVCSNGNTATNTYNTVNYQLTFCPNGQA